MTSGAMAGDGAYPTGEAAWWYKAGGGSMGPVTAAELARLAAAGVLRRDAPVWTDGFGSLWKRLDEAGVRLGEGPPPDDHGPWADAFARIEADPKARPRSWLGAVLGPVAYFRHGLWTKGLLILAAWLAVMLAATLVQDGLGMSVIALPLFPLMVFCSRNLKYDYYRYRVLGERVWPRFARLDNVPACAVACVLLFLAVGVAEDANPVDGLNSNIVGVWQADDLKIVIDTAGEKKTITYDGLAHRVTMRNIEATQGVIVFATDDSGALITLSKHVDPNGTYSLDVSVDDAFIGNFLYLRPV